MPYEIVVEAPRKIVFREYQDRNPRNSEVLIKTLFSGIKTGTELNTYRGNSPFANETWDPDLRVFRPLKEGEEQPPFFPQPLGSWASGVVLQVGENVRQFKEGDLVHGMWMHRQTALVPEDKLYPIRNGENVERVLFTDPARFALAGIHDAQIKLGDRVAIFGLGAIGMLAIQMAHLNGAAQVFAIDPNPSRRQIAKSIGADFALDPAEIDAGIAIKEATFSKGVDVAIEISGVYSALQQALRSVHKEGTVVTVSYYGQQLNHVDLSKEWHHNRITLRSSMPGWGCASRFYPMWDLARLEQTVITMIEEQKLDVDPMFGDRISFHNAPLAYEKIDRSLESGVKVIFVYD